MNPTIASTCASGRPGPPAPGAARGGPRGRARGGDAGAGLGDELDDRLDRLVLVAEALERPRDRLVDDLHGPAADQLLVLDQREVRLDAGRVAVHHAARRPGGGRPGS